MLFINQTLARSEDVAGMKRLMLRNMALVWVEVSAFPTVFLLSVSTYILASIGDLTNVQLKRVRGQYRQLRLSHAVVSQIKPSHMSDKSEIPAVGEILVLIVRTLPPWLKRKVDSGHPTDPTPALF